MSIGGRILQARTELGLSQRQLAGDYMTRNMLSAIEHDKANPSLDTLIYMAGVLKKPVGYFLGEDGPAVDGYPELVQARSAYDAGEYRKCLELLEQIPQGDVLGRETGLLRLLSLVMLAEQAVQNGKRPFARDVLGKAEKAMEQCPYGTPELERRIAILRASAAGRPEQTAQYALRIAEDESLTLKAKGALAENRYADARRYLMACDNRDDGWHYLMGDAMFGLKDYTGAAEHYHAVEETMGKAVRKKLQFCYAELKDFEKAYRYAIMK